MNLRGLLDARPPQPLRLAAVVAAALAGFVLAWKALPPNTGWGWVRNGLAWPGFIEILLGLVAFAIGLGIIAAVAAAAGFLAHLIFSQTTAFLGGLVVAGALLGVLAMAVQDTPAWNDEGKGGAEDMGRLADGIFDTHVIALEVLGVLLTAAMIGAMVIARPLGVASDDTHYATRLDDEHLAAVAHASDVDDNLGGEA